MAERDRCVEIRRREFLRDTSRLATCGTLFFLSGSRFIGALQKEQKIQDEANNDTVEQGYSLPDRSLVNLSRDIRVFGELRLRGENPEEIIAQLPQVKKLLEQANVAEVQDKNFQRAFKKNLDAKSNERPTMLRYFVDCAGVAVGCYEGFIAGLVAYCRRFVV